MKISEIMNSDVKTISPENTALDAAKVLSENEIGSVVVVNGKEVPGIVTERDVIDKIAQASSKPEEISVKEIMTPDPETVRKNSDIKSAINLMKEEEIEHLPVLSEQKLVGILSSYELLEYGVEKLEEEEVEFLIPSLLNKK